jgi:tetratricopeptide (TPR) repeat protein
VKPGSSSAGDANYAEKDITESIASASELLRAGKLDHAKTKIEEALQIDANNIQALELQQQWNSTLSAQKARKHRDEMETLRKQEKNLEWTRRAEKLYKEGKYTDLQAVLDQWIDGNPQSAEARALRIQSAAVLRRFQLYDLAMNEKRYDDALSEVGRAEQMNPGDPALAELRKRAESRKGSARATLTVYRIGEPAILTLDDERIGTNGQVDGLSVRVGRHKISLKNSRGLEASRSHEFTEGQNAFMVYDASGPVLRPMTDSDRDLVNSRKAAEQVQHFPVEHKHIWLRGKCAGDLVISAHDVEYKSKLEAHAFRIPFRNLYLKVEGQKVGIYFRSDDKELRSFEVKDAAQAAAIQGAWTKKLALVN